MANENEIDANEVLDGGEIIQETPETPERINEEPKKESSIKQKRQQRRQKPKIEIKGSVEDELSEQAKKFHEMFTDTFTQIPEMRVTIRKRSEKSGRYEYVPNAKAVVFTPNDEDFDDLVYRIAGQYGWGDYSIILKADKKYKMKPYQYSFSISQPEDEKISKQMPEYSPFPTPRAMSDEFADDSLAKLLANQKNDSDKQTLTMMWQMMKDAKGENAGLIQKMLEMQMQMMTKPQPQEQKSQYPQANPIDQVTQLLGVLLPVLKQQTVVPTQAVQMPFTPAQPVDQIEQMTKMLAFMGSMKNFFQTGELPTMGSEEAPKSIKDKFADAAIGGFSTLLNKIAENAGQIAVPLLMNQMNKPAQLPAPQRENPQPPPAPKIDERQKKMQEMQQKIGMVFAKMMEMLDDQNTSIEDIVAYTESSLPKQILLKMKQDSAENIVESLITSARAQNIELNAERVNGFAESLKGINKEVQAEQGEES